MDDFDSENANEELAKAIIMHDYPLSIVDHIGFRRFTAALQPMYKVPSQNIIKKEIFKIYDTERSLGLKSVDSNEGRVAITVDMWTSSHKKRGYMAVTAHYIDSSWTLQKRVVRFIYVPVPHTSDRLSNILVDCLMDLNIDTKLSTITLDNCSPNDSMIDKVKDKLQLDRLLRNGALLQMPCCAHILNLIANDGLEVVKDGVEKIRDSVVYWTATPKRIEKFKETTRQLHILYTRKLCLDCPTRWNTTYKMLDIAMVYKDVFCRLKQRESQYTCLPTDTQWELTNKICGQLKLFNNVIELFSGTKYPTASLCFPLICEIKLAISQWLMSPDEVIRKMARKMRDKFQNYWNVIHDIMGVATVLDPRFKMLLLEYYNEKSNEDDSFIQINRIRQLCYNLLSDYQLKSRASSSSSPLLDAGNITVDGPLSGFELFVSRKKRAKASYVKRELDHYLEEEILPGTRDIDILLWWKLEGKYPTLQAIAKDVLAIPIFTSASEGGRILSPHRSRLHWTTTEALICAKSWLWSEVNNGIDSKGIEDYATSLDEMESEDEEGLLLSGVTYQLEDD